MKRTFICSFFIAFIFIVSTANAQQSLNMQLLAHWDDDSLPVSQNNKAFNDCWGYAAPDGREYAILCGAADVFFFDITDPENFILVAQIPGGTTTNWRDIKTWGDRAYAVSDASNEGMLIFDLSNLPDEVTMINQTTAHFERAHNIFIDEFGRAFVVGIGAVSGDVLVYDLTADPDNPQLLANVGLPGGGYVHDINVVNNIAYCSHGNNGLYIWDFTDPANPVLEGSIVTGAYNHASTLSEDGSIVLFAEETLGKPLGLLDVSDFTEIELINSFSFPLLAPQATNNVAHNPFIVGDLAYVSYYEDGIQVFNIADPMNPEQVAYYDTWESNTSYNTTQGNWGVYPYLPSGRIVVSDSSNGLFVLELAVQTNTENKQKSAIELSPNPTSNELVINGIEQMDIEKYYVYNMLGELLLEGDFKTSNKINVKTLSIGIYTITVRNKDEIVTKFFIKN